MEQVPAAGAALHVSPAPSLTVTLPVGVPFPGDATATVNFSVTAWPATEVAGDCEVMVVVVPARLTVCAAPAEVLELKFVLPL